MAYFEYKGKNVYYEEAGNGSCPLLLLHGNTASSKMFDGIIELYKNDYKLILTDFLGHGQSDRINEFPADFWYDEAMQAIELISSRNYGKVNIIGTSGGALVALNVALERSDLVDKVIADSFEGEQSLDAVANTIVNERQQSKSHKDGYMFWEYCHGSDWESVVDNDTNVIIRHHKSVKNFFHKDLSQLDIPVMLSASHKDEYADVFGLEKAYKAMLSKITNGKLHLFETGGHPAMLTNAKGFSDMAKIFFMGSGK